MRTTALLVVALLGCQSGSGDRSKPKPQDQQPGQGGRPGSGATAGGEMEGGFFQRSAQATAELGLPGARIDLSRQLGSASRIAIGDLDGDGTREIVAADAENLRVLDAAGNDKASAPVVGGILTLTAADIDGDHKSEIYAGWGQTREHMDAPAKI